MYIKLTHEQKWRRLTRWLRREFPLHRTVTVRRGTFDVCGDCRAHKSARGGFKIRIAKNQCFELVVDSLLHEWAHAMTWFSHDDDDHGPSWGLKYAELYRTFLAWNFGRPLIEEDE